MRRDKCSVKGCRRVAKVKGFCRLHYHRHRQGRRLEDPIVKRVQGPIEERLRAHSKIDKGTGCHLWLGHRSPGGYGVINVAGRSQLVHRAAWEAANGPIPDGMVVMHTCDNPSCCNAEHLELGSLGDNTRDRFKKGRGPGARARDLELNPQWAMSPLWARRALSQNRAAKQGVEKIVERPQGIGLNAEDQDDEDHRCDVHAAQRRDEAAQRGQQ